MTELERVKAERDTALLDCLLYLLSCGIWPAVKIITGKTAENDELAREELWKNGEKMSSLK